MTHPLESPFFSSANDSHYGTNDLETFALIKKDPLFRTHYEELRAEGLQTRHRYYNDDSTIPDEEFEPNPAILKILADSERAGRDTLTNLPNYHSFEKGLQEKIDALHLLSKEEGDSETALFVLFIDLDEFKTINDTHGHAVGDEVLKHLAQILRTSFREEDLVARRSGDEFVVAVTIKSKKPKQVILEKAEALRRKTEIFRRRGEQEGASSIPAFTLSIGVARFETTAKTLLDQADQAMYHSKRNGRNQVSWFNPEKGTLKILPKK